ncbi:expressed unknown protein [Seminavis robusta]|uniref:Uncharacterized protein n=1 Tax=Seminavis robusta TaxID=568900 RepID=A0A9N8EIP1_9STRA|nr:expressed unknown protein [Seminavis robusta]|eukprot:Sro1234_g254940.1 n/a (184) ;mRNA; r:30191-30742
MELSRFLALALPALNNCSLVVDNAATHFSPENALARSPPPTMRKSKLCRWDSSLSKRECLAPLLDSPKRSSDETPEEATFEMESSKLIFLDSPVQSYDEPENERNYGGSSYYRSQGGGKLQNQGATTKNDAHLSRRRFSFDCDMSWAEKLQPSPTTSLDACEPPRMPLRTTGDFFPEADEREQ